MAAPDSIDATIGEAPVPRRRWSPTAVLLIAALVATGVLAVLSVGYMGEAVTSCSTTVRGAPSDGSNGAVWLNWAWDRNGNGPFDTTQQLTGGGRDDSLWRPVMVVNATFFLPMYALGQATDPRCGYGLMEAVGYVTTGLGMWALAYWLTRRRAVATVAAVVYAFSGFTQMKATAHPSGVMLGLFPLLLLGLLRLWQRPTRRRALGVAVPWALLAYTDGYYLVFSAVAVVGMVVGMVLGLGAAAVLGRPRSSRRDLVVRARMLALATATTLLLLVPVAVATLANGTAATGVPDRSLRDAVAYSARPLEYLVPPLTHPWFGHLATDLLPDPHGSNPVESTIYLGWVPLLLALLAVAWVMQAHRRRSADPGGVSPEGARFGSATIVAGLLGVAVVAFVTSLAPTYRLFGIPVPMPSRLVRTVLPQIRAFSRLFVVVSAAVVALAAMGLATVLQRIDRASVRLGVAIVVAVVALGESLTFSPFDVPVWSIAQAPQVYRDLAADPSIDMVARYPLDDPSENTNTVLFTFQPVLDTAVVNPISDTPAADDPVDIARGIGSLTDPQTVPVLRALGTDALVVERVTYGDTPPSEVLDGLGLELERHYSYDVDDAPNQRGQAERWRYMSPYSDVDLFHVTPGPVATVVLALGSGWSSIERDGWSATRSVDSSAELTAVHLGDAAPAGATTGVTFRLGADADGGRVEVRDGDEVLTAIDVPVAGVDVAVDLPVDRTVHLVVVGGGTVAISDLGVETRQP